MINQPPALSPDPAWLAGRPALLPLTDESACCVVVALSDGGLEHALTAGVAGIRNLAGQQVAPDLDAARSLFWRITGPPMARFPTGIETISAIDRLLGRTDARDPLLIRTLKSADALHAAFHLPEDLVWFDGHFPGDPVLPGLAQLRLAIRNVPALTGREFRPGAIHQLKFKLPIRPDQIVELALRRNDDGTTVHFSIRSAAGEHSSGRLTCGVS